MANPYIEIFKKPGAIGFSSAGALTRLPLIMANMAIVAMLTGLGYSYGVSSTVAACFTVSKAFMVPIMARFADTYGQSKVALVSWVIVSLSMIALIYAAYHQASVILLCFFAITANFIPSFGAFIRARWTNLYKHSPLLQTALAFESTLDEVLVMIGMFIALTLTARYAPAVGTITAVVLYTIGIFAFLAQKKTEPKVVPPEDDSAVFKKPTVLRIKDIFLICIVILATGVIYSALQISVFAYTKEIGEAEYSSLIISAYSIGSLTAGAIYGMINWKTPLPKLYLYIIAFSAIMTFGLLISANLYWLFLIMLLIGASNAPSAILMIIFIEKIVPKDQLIEGISWLVTFTAIGMAIGSPLTGYIIDFWGPKSGFYAPVIGGILLLITLYISYKSLKDHEDCQEI